MNRLVRVSVLACACLTQASARSASPEVPRSTFGRAPVIPVNLVLLTPVERTAAPLPTFTVLAGEDRSLPLTPGAARMLRFEARLVPVAHLAPLRQPAREKNDGEPTPPTAVREARGSQ